MSTDIELSRSQLPKIIQSGRFLGASLRKLEVPLMKVAVPLAKNIWAPLGITAAVSAIDAGIHGSGTTTLIISSEEMNDILKLSKLLKIEESDRKFAAQDRKIALIVGNCPARPIIDGL